MGPEPSLVARCCRRYKAPGDKVDCSRLALCIADALAALLGGLHVQTPDIYREVTRAVNRHYKTYVPLEYLRQHLATKEGPGPIPSTSTHSLSGGS